MPYLAIIAVVVAFFLAPGFVRYRRQSEDTGSAMAKLDSEVLVDGWSAEDLRAILDRFEKMYKLGPGRLQVIGQEGEWMRVKADEPISADELFYLINYVHYPHDFDLKSVDPVAVGLFVTVDRMNAKGVVPGTHAKAYVPTNDTEHDQVFVALENGTAYRVSFATVSWRKVTDARMGAKVHSVPFDGPGR